MDQFCDPEGNFCYSFSFPKINPVSRVYKLLNFEAENTPYQNFPDYPSIKYNIEPGGGGGKTGVQGNLYHKCTLYLYLGTSIFINRIMYRMYTVN